MTVCTFHLISVGQQLYFRIMLNTFLLLYDIIFAATLFESNFEENDQAHLRCLAVPLCKVDIKYSLVIKIISILDVLR